MTFRGSRNCGRWFDKVVVKLPEIILSKAMLDKISLVNVLELTKRVIRSERIKELVSWSRNTIV